MLGGMAMKWRWRAKQKALGKPTDKPNFVCGPVQVCWHKFARYWDVEIREIPMEPRPALHGSRAHARGGGREHDRGRSDIRGHIHRQLRISGAAARTRSTNCRRSKGLDIDIHVDAASGGFLAPFCAPEIPWDFRLPRVKSISSSGHKYGLAPLGCGWVIWRDQASLPDDLVFKVDYLGGQVGTFAINFSRPAGQVI